MTVERDAFLREVMLRGGIVNRSNAEAAVCAVLGALAAHLSLADARRVGSGLPADLSVALERLGHWTPQHPRTLYVWIAAFEDASVRRAAEHAQVVCRVLAESVDAERRALLGHRLPSDWAALFASREEPPLHADPSGSGAATAAGAPTAVMPEVTVAQSDCLS
jgi:uncharacterized protein (DUF2267 family)